MNFLLAWKAQASPLRNKECSTSLSTWERSTCSLVGQVAEKLSNRLHCKPSALGVRKRCVLCLCHCPVMWMSQICLLRIYKLSLQILLMRYLSNKSTENWLCCDIGPEDFYIHTRGSQQTSVWLGTCSFSLWTF